jgi:diacylglycerol kinase (ATP)
MTQLVVLVNPNAGSGRAGGVWDALLGAHPELARAHVVRESRPDAAAAGLRAAFAAGCDTVIAVGGDGTAHMVSNVLVGDGLGERVALGLVPGGTGSDLCKSLGLPSAPGPALARALAGEPKPLDAFEVRRPADPAAPVRYCVNTVSTGLSGNIVEAVNRLTRRGSAIYLKTTVKALWRYRPVSYRVTVDGAVFHEGPTFLLAIANGVNIGKGMRVAPHAKLDDGLADVVVIGDVPRWQLPFRLPQVVLGWHAKAKPVRMVQARAVTCEQLGPPPTAYELDGDVGAPGPLAVRVLAGALRVLR